MKRNFKRNFVKNGGGSGGPLLNDPTNNLQVILVLFIYLNLPPNLEYVLLLNA